MKMKFKITVTLALLVALLELETNGVRGQQEFFQLKGVVWAQGSPVPGVEVELEGGGAIKRQVGADDGRFAFRVPAGTYDLTLRLAGFYTTVLHDIVIRKQPLQEISVTLQPWLRDEVHSPLVVGPKRVPPPSLEIFYEADPPKTKNQVMTGKVTLRNTGSNPVLIPTVKSYADSDQTLRMNLTVVTDYEAIHNSWYACRPPDGCLKLREGEQHTIPITFYKRSGDHDEPQVYHKPGRFTARIGVSFIPKGKEYVRTETIKATYAVEVKW